MSIFIMIMIVIFLFCLYFINRNNQVYNERKRVLRLISYLSQKDIENKKPWRWRYDEFDKISYNKMVYTFWKPVKSFYMGNIILQL